MPLYARECSKSPICSKGEPDIGVMLAAAHHVLKTSTFSKLRSLNFDVNNQRPLFSGCAQLHPGSQKCFHLMVQALLLTFLMFTVTVIILQPVQKLLQVNYVPTACCCGACCCCTCCMFTHEHWRMRGRSAVVVRSAASHKSHNTCHKPESASWHSSKRLQVLAVSPVAYVRFCEPLAVDHSADCMSSA